MNLPEIKFSNWHPWHNRKGLADLDKSGVYILAKLDEPPKEVSADPLDENIIYIGETCGQTLSKRLYQFHCSAFLNKNGHSGGWSYCDHYGDRGENLYVAVCQGRISQIIWSRY